MLSVEEKIFHPFLFHLFQNKIENFLVVIEKKKKTTEKQTKKNKKKKNEAKAATI